MIDPRGIEKIPRMEKKEYKKLIKKNYLCRIAFKGDDYPKIAPFVYYSDGKDTYFLASRYGEKIKYFRENPKVSIEIEEFEEDFSRYGFVTLDGRLVEVKDDKSNTEVRENFIELIKKNGLSKNILKAFGLSPARSISSIKEMEKNMVWKLSDIKRITALKS